MSCDIELTAKTATFSTLKNKSVVNYFTKCGEIMNSSHFNRSIFTFFA